MRSGIASRAGRLIGIALLSLAGFAAQAATLTVLIDSDNNPATGCTVVTSGGPFAGVESVLATTVTTTTNPPTVGVVTQSDCVAPPAGFGPAVPVAPGGWQVGVGVGTGGVDVIETFFPAAAPAGTYRFGFTYQDPLTGADETLTATGAPGGGPIVFAFGTTATIPTLSDAAIVLLALTLWFFAARSLKRRGAPPLVVAACLSVILASAALAAIVLDGQVGDWTGTSPIASDPSGDASPGSDIRAVFARSEGGRIYLRADVKVGTTPAPVADAYTTAAATPLTVVAPGVLANDNTGTPAGTITSFGGGSLGGPVTANAAGALAGFGVGGFLTVAGNGAFNFTPAAGFTGAFTFNYRVTNGHGTGDGTVTITVSQAPAITSAASTSFAVGAANTFTVTTTGTPIPAITFTACAPALPAGVTFTDNGNGTGTLAGNPGTGTAGTRNCTVTATNGVGAPATQAFALVITEGPAAVADGYTTVHDTPLAVVAPGVLGNDTLGSPAATLTSFGGGSLGGAVTANAAGTTANFGAGGALTVNANGSINFTPVPGFAGAFTFLYRIDNGLGSSDGTVTITVTNALPVADLNGPAAGIDFGPVSFTEAGPAVAIVDPAQLTVTDADHANLASATVVIGGGADGASESIGYTCPGVAPACSGAILVADVTYTAGTYTLAINRSASVADYQALLRTLTYGNAAASATGTGRDITVTLNDGIGAANPVSHATVTIAGANSAPVITAPATATTPVNSPLNFAAGISVADSDAGTNPIRVTLTGTQGTATLSGTAGLTVTGNGTAAVTITGPIASINAALNGVVFTPTAAFAGAASLRIDADDQGNTGTGGAQTATRTVAITVDNPPTVTSTVPAGGATSVNTTATITVNFSEAVTVGAGSFTLACPVGSPVAFTTAPAGPAASYTLTPTAPLPAGVTCTLTVVAAQVTDAGGLNMAANHVVTFAVNTTPGVTSTTPANGATGVAPSATITVNFSESVNATAAAFSLECPVATPVGFTKSPAGPASAYTLTPSASLPAGTTCTVTVIASNVTDVDATQAMAANYVFSFTTATVPAITSAASTNFTVGQAGSFTVTTTGAPAPAITRTGTLPSGVTFTDNGNGTGTLSGTPGAGTAGASPYAQVFTATNVAGSGNQNFTLNVCPVLSSTPASIPAPTRTNAYTTTIAGSGGTGPYTFAVTGGALPAGLSLAAGGTISGTVTGAGAYSFTVTITDTANACTGTTAYSGTVNEPPLATADSYQAVGNTLLEVAGASAAAGPKIFFSGNVIANDNNGDGGANGTGLTVTAGTTASANGGSVTMAADGTFTYLPPANFTGADTFTYTVSDGVGTGTGTVTVTVITRVWYVDNTATAGGTGRSDAPFNTLAAAQAASSAGDTIYLYRGDGTATGQNAGIVLKDTQRLVGAGVALDVVATVNAVVNPTLLAIGTAPTIGNTGGNGITLALNNLVKGLSVGNSSGYAVRGTNVGTLAITAVTVNTTGGGVYLTGTGNPAVAVAFTGVTSTGGTYNAAVENLGGSVDFGTGSLSGGTTSVFAALGGNGTVTYQGTIANTLSGSRAVNVQNRTGGTITLGGAVTASGLNPGGVVLANNTGATINLTGGLDLSTGTSGGFTATGGGTVSATQNNTSIVNTVSTTSGPAVTLSGVTANLTFRSVRAAGGGATGISITNHTGSFTVTGNSLGICGGLVTDRNTAVTAPVLADCTGGTIANMATGIRLSNAQNISLTRMRITGTSAHNFGIYGTQVNGFTMARSVIDGNIGTNSALQDGPLVFGANATQGLTGTVSITDSTVTGGVEHNAEFYSNSGTANITIARSVFSSNSALTGSDGILMEFQSTADANILVDNCQFVDNRSQGLQLNALDNSSVDFTLRNSRVESVTQGNEGVVLSNASNASLVASVDTNVITGLGGTSLFVGNAPGNATASSLLHATIANNTVTAGPTAFNHTVLAYFTSTAGQPAAGRVRIANNTVTQSGNNMTSRAILVDTPDAGATPVISAIVTGNNVTVPSLNAPGPIQVASRQGGTACFDISGSTGFSASLFPMVTARQGGTAVVSLFGAGVDAASVLAANNAPSSTGVLGGTINLGGACAAPNTPTLP